MFAPAAGEYLRLAAAAKPKEHVLCVAPTGAENHELTKCLHEGLRAAEHLGEARNVVVLDPLGWTTQQSASAITIVQGKWSLSIGT